MLRIRLFVPFFLGLVSNINQAEKIPSWWQVRPLFQAPVMRRAVRGVGEPGLGGKRGAPRDGQLKPLSPRICSQFQIIPSRRLSVRADTRREPQGSTALTAEGAGNRVTEDLVTLLLSASCFLIGCSGGRTGRSLGKGLQMRI